MRVLIGFLMYWMAGPFVPLVVEAATYYVSTSGSDGNSCPTAQTGGATPTNAKRTVNNAITNCLSAGDTLHIGDGSFPERINDTVPGGVDAAHPTIIEGNGAVGCGRAETCSTILDTDGHDFITHNLLIRNMKITGINNHAGSGTSCLRFNDNGTPRSGVTIDNVELDRCSGHGIFMTSDYSGLTLRNFSIHHTNQVAGDTTGHGGYLEGDNTLIENGEVHDITLGVNVVGFQIFDSTPGKGGTVANAVVRNVNFKNITKSDSIVVAGKNATLYNNTFNTVANGTSRGITLYGGSSSNRDGCNTGFKAYNNTVVGHGIGVSIGTFASGCSGLTADLSNNIVIGATDALDLEQGWTNSGSNNAGDMQTNWDINTAPQSGTCGSACGTNPITIAAITDVTLSTTDFHLKGAPNCAIDAGAILVTVATDQDGILRPQGSGYDVGAFELPFGTPPPPLPNTNWSVGTNLRLP